MAKQLSVPFASRSQVEAGNHHMHGLTVIEFDTRGRCQL